MNMKLWQKIMFGLILAVFVYLRVDPIIHHTVPYTYDQGRDFLKVMEMIDAKRPTFIGPTTGIMGLFHGAWWYYLLTIPSLLTHGSPIAFYYFVFAISLAANLWLFQFLKRKFDTPTALVFLAVISVSPYFVKLAFTVSNNVIVPYLLIALIGLSFQFFEKDDKRLYFLLGLTLGFVFEFEVAFGLLLIPAYFASALLFRVLRNKIYSLKNLGLIVAGLAVPFIPRALFEIKNGFIQTKTIIGFFINPKLHNPAPFQKMLSDRIILFIDYAKSITYGYSLFYAVLMAAFAVIVFFALKKKNKKTDIALYLATLVLMLFAISLFYKDNFWANYYEGIQYLYLVVFVSACSLLAKWNKKAAYALLMVFVIVDLIALNNYNLAKKTVRLEGLAETQAAFDYIHKQTGKNDYCLRIYTPPVIPHTYVYLMNWQAKAEGYKISSYNFRDNQCYFVIESDVYAFRIKKWREDNTPKGATMAGKKQLNGNVTVEKWVLK
ncbi:MAG: glycosyltransferase family 39 protein [Patescibacteria group bacterium]